MAYKRISPVPVVEGGTGVQTLTSHGVLLGNTTSAVTATAAGTNGQVIIGATAGAPAFATITSTGSTITFTPGANTLNMEVTNGPFAATLTGNSGTATESASNINVIDSQGTGKFTGSGSTLTHTYQDAFDNVVIGGSGSGGSLTAASLANTIFGGDSGTSIDTGQFNTLVGWSHGISLTSGGENVMVGANCGQFLTTGSSNILIGNDVGRLYTTSETGNIIIAAGAWAGEIVGESQTLRIGDSSHSLATQAAYICGIQGVNVGNTATVVTTAGTNANQLGSAVITAGTNISVTPTANTITIAATGAGSFGWSVITANQTAAINNGYFCNKAGTLALALPATSAVGDVIEVANINTALGVQFTQAAGQQIFFATASTTLGATGTLTSSAVGDTLKMVCRTANTVWQVVSSIGNWTPA